MKDPDSVPQVGELVRILNGRDKDQFAFIIDVVNERFVKVADGDKRKVDRAKKKNIQHIERVNIIAPEVKNSIVETGRVTNAKLRFAISTYIDDNLLKEGD
ncbi:RNA-binding protein [Salipaludibacillus agaradhaerens]|jgi:ribosomal protein L14E/L6E/L27E|uniref:RNA-binding protein n=1 Tax=Salipaludibacillus agaradhaerens TaxID=76935 RepID=A0A9Q4B5G3_SALAG|nr:KOW domain-containing RNA-binding protein [Salipaludibacillus agaradhaerens]MCR6108907.1 RNA-binding protein [Bacillus sp. A301a_S52]UJW56081.1 RNA-binding protein [Bacillus sp. A116_S68]MCR6098322.1 RNA-binding protein [Salipaludibacillus agaradhaerens]MCR6104842.1 RNA-binding protein [Salipaludibacillus agaradhaerens]MCR6116048.1 RNA-binding protein [Salipaludibacillus agaradhaerens]